LALAGDEEKRVAPDPALIQVTFDPHVAVALVALVFALIVVLIMTTIPIGTGKDKR
jgi:hypothetical protein